MLHHFSHYPRFMQLRSLHPNVWLLSVSHALSFAGASVTFLLGGIIGTLLAPSLALATLPVAVCVIGTAVGTLPATRLMQRMGRKTGFIGGAVFSVGASLLGAIAVWQSHFWLYCLACFGLGLSYTFVQQYRFAAAESVAIERAPQAISAILISGIAGAFLGPNVANYAHDWIPEHTFVGSYLALAVLLFIPCILLLWLQSPSPSKASKPNSSGRTIFELAKQPDFILAVFAATVAYALMVFLMTATPMSMHVMDGHSVDHTSFVIQWHIVAMFLPSLFVGKLIIKYGHKSIMLAGVIANLVCICVSQFDQSLLGYWISLFSLGLGWNFLFVSSTSLLITTYQEDEKYRAQGFNEFIMFSVQAMASLSAGWLLSMTSWQSMNLMSVPALVILLGVILWSHQKSKQVV